MAREEEKKEQEVEEGQPKKQGALVKWMAIGVVAAVVIAGAVVGVLYFKGDSGKKEAAQAKEQPVSAVGRWSRSSSISWITTASGT